jgi:hypothetical protein
MYGITIRNIRLMYCTVCTHFCTLHYTNILAIFRSLRRESSWPGLWREEVRTGTAIYIVQFMHCTENPIYLFPEKKLCGLVPNSYIHVSVSDLYIPRMDLPIWMQQNRQTYCSQIHVGGAWETVHWTLYRIQQCTRHCTGPSSALDLV